MLLFELNMDGSKNKIGMEILFYYYFFVGFQTTQPTRPKIICLLFFAVLI